MTKKIIIKKVKIKIKKKDPVLFTGKVLRELSDDKEFTLAKFKKRYCLRIKGRN